MSSSLTPPHTNTSISQQNKEVEADLQAQLNKYAMVIRLGLENAPNNAKWTHLRGIIEPRLHDSVSQTIRASLTKSYELGAAYVTNKVGLQHATFTTHNDIDNIKSLSDEFTRKFFARVQFALDSAIRKNEAETNTAISTSYIVTPIAISSTTKALAEGSKQKAKALIMNNRRVSVNKYANPIQTAQDEDIEFDDLVFTDTTIESLAADELEEQQWIWVCGDDACAVCQSLEGETWTMDELDFMPMPSSDTHPNCLVPDTVVTIPRDLIVSALRAWYSGPIIELYMMGCTVPLTVTPNHMLLTPQGFAAADLLMEGDNVIYSPTFNNLPPGQPNVDGHPARIDQIFKSLSESTSMYTVSMPLTTKDLHGDARFCDGNIDIVSSTSPLQNNVINASRMQFLNTINLRGGTQVITIPFPPTTPFNQILFSAACAADGLMSGSRQSASFFRRRLRHTQKHGFTFSALLDTPIIQDFNNSIPANTKMLRDLLDRHSTIIQRRNITKVNIHPYTGPVYDLQTIPTVYVGNGIILSNCRCRLLLM